MYDIILNKAKKVIEGNFLWHELLSEPDNDIANDFHLMNRAIKISPESRKINPFCNWLQQARSTFVFRGRQWTWLWYGMVITKSSINFPAFYLGD